jgi:hypothetical protein
LVFKIISKQTVEIRRSWISEKKNELQQTWNSKILSFDLISLSILWKSFPVRKKLLTLDIDICDDK